VKYYLSIARDHFDQIMGELLKKELRRFDIRAEFQESDSLKEAKYSSADAIIHITSSNQKIRSELPGFILNISTRNNSRRNQRGSSKYQITYFDLPSSQERVLHYLGCPLFDVFKNIQASSNATSYDRLNIPIIIGYNRQLKSSDALKLSENVLSTYPKVDTTIIDLEQDLKFMANTLKDANAAIVTSWMGELAALYFNVPYIFYTRKFLFRNSINSLQKELVQKKIVREIHNTRFITAELERILNDHQYTAAMLQNFQTTKEFIGNKPSIRCIARDITERLAT